MIRIILSVRTYLYFVPVFLWLLQAVQPAYSLENDALQPIQISADSAEFNPGQGVAVYRGQVEIVRGSLRVQAEEITLYQNSSGQLERAVAISRIKPVHLQQKPAEQDPVVHAYAMRIEYFAAENSVLLLEQAQLENGRDRFTGDEIRYNLKSRIIQARGRSLPALDQEPDDNSAPGRVRILLYPDQTQGSDSDSAAE